MIVKLSARGSVTPALPAAGHDMLHRVGAAEGADPVPSLHELLHDAKHIHGVSFSESARSSGGNILASTAAPQPAFQLARPSGKRVLGMCLRIGACGYACMTVCL